MSRSLAKAGSFLRTGCRIRGKALAAGRGDGPLRQGRSGVFATILQAPTAAAAKASALAALAGVALAGLGAAPLRAEPYSEVLFSHKHWQVSGVVFEDKSMACKAEVSSPGDSFSLWFFQDGVLRLQFYSTQWKFDGGTADLVLQIDRRSPWTLNGANLYENSVLFDLPAGDDTGRFLVEIAQGNKLFLRSASNEDVMWYSLSGSRASMDAMIACAEALTQQNPSNPFQ